MEVVSPNRQLHLLGASGACRAEMVDGKERLVVPVIALMGDHVIHAVNAQTPEFVPSISLSEDPSSWDGMPLVVGHPVKDGIQVSAKTPGELEKRGFGEIRASKFVNGKLAVEAWADPARLIELGHDAMLADMRAGKPIEVSVGAHVLTRDVLNGEHKGKKYAAEWMKIAPDHLAFLPGGRGACSLAMGCGSSRAAMRMLEDRMVDVVDSIIDPKTLKCLRDIPKSERDKLDTSDFAGPHESFPILTQADVDAAKHLVGQAADPAAVKAKIIAIAKRKGLTVPKGWTTKAAEARSLRERLSALVTAFRAQQPYDTPSEAASEEAAELIAYQTIRSLLDQCGKGWDEASGLCDDLIADETENPTETAADEDAEEEVEAARLEAISALCMSMYSAINGVMDVVRAQLAEDINPPRYMSQHDCTACNGSGKIADVDCAVCDGLGQMKTAAGARNSASDMNIIQKVHDNTVSLGAACTPGNYRMAKGLLEIPTAGVVPLEAAKTCPTCTGTGKIDGQDCPTCGGTGTLKAAAATPQLKAACSCEESTMTKEKKAEIIAALVTDKHSGYKAGDETFLNAASDARLEEFKTAADANKLAAEAKIKTDNDLTAANAKVTVLEGKLKTAEQTPTEEEWLTKAPAGIKALLDHQKAQEAEEREALIKTLKAVGANTEDELKAMPTPQLKTLAAYAKVKTPDFSGRGIPIDRTAGDAEDFTPPDSYAEGIKALRETTKAAH